VDTLGLKDLSKESLKKLTSFPKNMRQQWIDDPDSAGAFTDEDVKILSDSLSVIESESVDINESKLYSAKYAEIIIQAGDDAFADASSRYETDIDVRAEQMNIFYDKMRDCDLDINDKELDFLAEKIFMGNYESERTKFITNGMINGGGGTFTVTQPDGITDDIGSKLRNRLEDVEDVVGETLGLPEEKGQNIFTTATLPSEKGAQFSVYYTNKLANADSVIKDAIKDEIDYLGYDADTFNMSLSDSVDKTVFNLPNLTDSPIKNEPKSKPFVVTPEMMHELEHAQSVLDGGYDDEGYNADGFDATGHSKDGDYNPQYDTAYTDQGFDF
jgi:hypothetical protein